MGRVEFDWSKAFRTSSSPGREDGIYLGPQSSAQRAAATRARAAALKLAKALPAAGKRARARAGAGAEGVATVSTDDEQPRGTEALLQRLEARCSELERRVGELRPGARSPVTRAAARKAAADGGLDAHSAAENVHNSNQEDELRAKKKKNNQDQANGSRKRVARPAAKKGDKEPAPPEEIFEALTEIPSLDQADLLRAYSMLVRDDRLFRSLMALPKDMRKEWLLMEIGN